MQFNQTSSYSGESKSLSHQWMENKSTILSNIKKGLILFVSLSALIFAVSEKIEKEKLNANKENPLHSFVIR